MITTTKKAVTWYALWDPGRYTIEYDLYAHPMTMELCDTYTGTCTIVHLVCDRDGTAVFTHTDGDAVIGAAFCLNPLHHPPGLGDWTLVEDPRTFPFPGVPAGRPPTPRDIGFPG